MPVDRPIPIPPLSHRYPRGEVLLVEFDTGGYIGDDTNWGSSPHMQITLRASSRDHWHSGYYLGTELLASLHKQIGAHLAKLSLAQR